MIMLSDNWTLQLEEAYEAGTSASPLYLLKTNSATVFVRGTCPELLIFAALNIFVKLCVSRLHLLPSQLLVNYIGSPICSRCGLSKHLQWQHLCAEASVPVAALSTT